MSSSERNLKESSSNEEDEICLKASYEWDTIIYIKLSYAQLFRIRDQLEKKILN